MNFLKDFNDWIFLDKEKELTLKANKQVIKLKKLTKKQQILKINNSTHLSSHEKTRLINIIMN